MSNKGDADEEYEHWTAQEAHKFMQPVLPVQGYDTYNGSRSHAYRPAGAPIQAAPEPDAQQPQMMYYQPAAMPMPAYPMGYPAAQYTFHQPGAAISYGAPYGPIYGAQMMPIMSYGMQPGYAQQPPAGPVSYLGRTAAEVEEDNMKIAAREGAYDRRKIAPIGVKDDQMMWVVELDGSHTLRTFLSITELEGEWKKDPRFEDSYYFVREGPECDGKGK